MKNKVFLLLLGLIIAISGCSGTKENVDGEKKLTIGICQLVQHAALDNATNGFIDAVKKEYGDGVNILNQNASGDSAQCTTIINNFVSRKVDLILANATSPLQAAASGTKTIPILGTSITDYGTALEISNFSGVVGGNVSGTSDLAPLKEQAEMIKEWLPDVKTVGILYCSAEANSIYQVNEMTKYLNDLGVEVAKFSFTDSNDVTSVTTNAVKNVDALYVPTDNVAASNIEAIANIVLPAKMPLFTGEKGPCSVGGVATLSIDYYNIGYRTGEMAVDILSGKSDISTMPVQYDRNPVKLYNKTVVDMLGLNVPSGYKAID